MSMGSEMAMDAMAERMAAEDAAAALEREEAFKIIRKEIRAAQTVDGLKNALLVLTSLLEDHG